MSYADRLSYEAAVRLRAEAEVRAMHEAAPADGAAYCVGPRYAGRLADLRDPSHFPVEGVCSCGVRVTRESPGAAWRHDPR